MRYAVVKDGMVVNAVEVEFGSDWHPEEGLDLVLSETASAGWTFDGNGFSPPPEEPPAAKTIFDGAEFLARLTDAEYGAILAASAQSVQLARWLDIFRLRGEIDVTGTTALAAKAGLIDVADAALNANRTLFRRFYTVGAINADDADARAFLAAIGADADTILAPE